ncbi:MAG: hypothetical protein M1825_002492 [Sarcosagium campestre]|nr:MAG: hypothetical protein M1825_002492 [Sarcosagium campestre]
MFGAAFFFLAAATPMVMAQDCISLPFLAFISNTTQFDDKLNQYIATDFARQKYEQILGCSGLDLSNTSNLYARYTASSICNSIVQNSKDPCSLSDADSKPLCADTCAQQAISEQIIISDTETCKQPSPDAMDQIRADFTVCSLPSSSLSGDCISGAQNEPENCGYSGNLAGLCLYCSKSSPNSTDSCCENSGVTTRCEGVTLPSTTSLPPLFPTETVTASAEPSGTGTAAPVASGGGLSSGQIAGVVVGSVLGALLLLGLLIFLIRRRRRRGSQGGSVFNQPTPARSGTDGMSFNPVGITGPSQQGYEVLHGGRIARMSALEAQSPDSSPQGAAVDGAAARRRQPTSSSDYAESPDEHTRKRPLQPPPGRRNGSLSSTSALGLNTDPSSPQSNSAGGDFSSPQGVGSQQSEQLPFFKDYYSTDEIHPNDKVSTLWAYQPRAGDEFELERGDMLKVIGLWDDGWATGVRLSQRAEDWDPKRRMKRDSGVSNGSSGPSSPTAGEVKAFPLVCVCLPEHWKKTVDGDLSTETDSSVGGLPVQGNRKRDS